jgi:hypothetical protein
VRAAKNGLQRTVRCAARGRPERWAAVGNLARRRGCASGLDAGVTPRDGRVDDSKLEDEVMRPRIAKVSLAKPTHKDGSKGTLFGTQEDALAFVGKKAKKGEKFKLWVASRQQKGSWG